MSASSSQRMLSLWLRRLPTDRIERWRDFSYPSPRGRVAAAARRLRQARQCRTAHRRRRRGGAARAFARSRAGAGARHASGASKRSRKMPRPSRLLEAIADWCLRYTPLVASIRPTACCSTSAAARICSAARTRWSRISARLERPALLIASPSPAPSARPGPPRITASRDVTPAARSAHCLTPLPLAALRLDAGTVAALARVGLKRIGDIIDLPRAR